VVSKCANPVCRAKFQYLYTGKLFAIEYRSYRRDDGSDPAPEFTKSFDPLRYFWLCQPCSQVMTIQASAGGGIRLAASRHDPDVKQAQGTAPFPADPGEFDFAASSAPRELTGKNVLKALKRELDFLENGGYRSGMGWRAPLFFEDSPICPRPAFCACPNTNCLLMNFVPPESRSQKVPCRHISLNEAGETLNSVYATATNEEIEEALREWLRNTIAELEPVTHSHCDPT
jgi:hypothetical protein